MSLLNITSPALHHNGSVMPTIEHPVICGTDFSKGSNSALEVATEWTKRICSPLLLIHAINEHLHSPLPWNLRTSLCLYERAELHREIEYVWQAGGQVTEVVKEGSPDQVLCDCSDEYSARLVILGSHRVKFLDKLLLGSVALHVAERASTPTLMVRKAEPLILWLHQKRRLRVLIGADFSQPSRAALSWARSLRQLGPCDVTVAFFDPQGTCAPASRLFGGLAAEEEFARVKVRENRLFRRYVRENLGTGSVTIRMEPDWEGSDAHLLHLAKETRSDLIIIGSHQWHGINRLAHRSISRGVLKYSQTNVACVPSHEKASQGWT